MEVSIRPLEPADLETLRELNREIFIHDKQFLDDLDTTWPDQPYGTEYFTRVVNQDGHVGFVAELDDEPVGYVALVIREPKDRTKKYVEVNNMAVTKDCRGKGIGTQLLHSVQEWAKEQQADRLLVGAAFGNTKAVHFYKKFGFEEKEVKLEKDI